MAGNAIFQAAETALQTGLTAGEMASAMAGGGAAVMIPLTFARTIAMRYGYYPNRVAGVAAERTGSGIVGMLGSAAASSAMYQAPIGPMIATMATGTSVLCAVGTPLLCCLYAYKYGVFQRNEETLPLLPSRSSSNSDLVINQPRRAEMGLAR